MATDDSEYPREGVDVSPSESRQFSPANFAVKVLFREWPTFMVVMGALCFGLYFNSLLFQLGCIFFGLGIIFAIERSSETKD